MRDISRKYNNVTLGVVSVASSVMIQVSYLLNNILHDSGTVVETAWYISTNEAADIKCYDSVSQIHKILKKKTASTSLR